MKTQKVVTEGSFAQTFRDFILGNHIGKLMLVCGSSVEHYEIYRILQSVQRDCNTEIVCFTDFAPNPDYSSVEKGVRMFRNEQCQGLMAIGGGSAIDVAKCIKLYADLPLDTLFITQKVEENRIPFLVVPTTAGTGSECTRFAVIYYRGEKQSITHESIIPDVVILDRSVLDTLPDYQRKATILDALSHAVESYWSVNSTPESMAYSTQAIGLIIRNIADYMNHDSEVNPAIMQAAYLAGKAINITQTTAGHAMCYKLTSLFGISHGHAAALCNKALWPFMLGHLGRCADPRGVQYLKKTMQNLASAFGAEDMQQGCSRFIELVDSLALPVPQLEGPEQMEMLVQSVNLTRLKNHPVCLNSQDLREIYTHILHKTGVF